ncbi:MAG: hypothetical protein RLN85_12790, partial [Pseudomonadales bacterium]
LAEGNLRVWALALPCEPAFDAHFVLFAPNPNIVPATVNASSHFYRADAVSADCHPPQRMTLLDRRLVLLNGPGR